MTRPAIFIYSWPGTEPSKQIQISRLHSHRVQQSKCGTRHTNVKCFPDLFLDWGSESCSTNIPSKNSICRVIYALLYGTATWMIIKAESKRFHVFVMRHLRQIQNIGKWQLILNEFNTDKSNLSSFRLFTLPTQSKMACHLNRFEDGWQRKQILYSQLREG